MVNLTPDEARMLALETAKRNGIRLLAQPAEPEDALEQDGYLILNKYATVEEFGVVALIKAVATFRQKHGENPTEVRLSPALYQRLCQILHVLAVPHAANLRVTSDESLNPHQYILRGPRNA